jgi:hypothetical protein
MVRDGCCRIQSRSAWNAGLGAYMLDWILYLVLDQALVLFRTYM